MSDDISEEVARLERDRPKTAAADAALLDLFESLLTHEPPRTPAEAMEAFMAALDAHIDRRVGAYVRGAEIVG